MTDCKITKEDIACLRVVILNYTTAQIKLELAIHAHVHMPSDGSIAAIAAIDKPAKQLRKARNRLNAWLDKLYAAAG